MAITTFASVYGASFPSKVVTIDENGNYEFFKDYYQDPSKYSSVLNYLFIKSIPLLIIYVLGVFAAYLNARLMVIVGQGTLKKVRDNMFSHMQSLPIVYFDRHSHGEIMSRFTNDTDTLRQLITQSLPMVIQSGLMMIFLMIFMFIYSPILAVVVIAMIVIMVFVTKKLGGKSGKYFVKQQVDVGQLNGYVEEMLSGIKVVKVFNHEEESIAHFDEVNEKLCDSATKANIYANILMPIMNNLGYISYGITIMVGSLLALNNVLGFTVAALIAYITYNRMFCNQVSQASNQFNLIILGIAGAERIFEIMDEASEADEGYVTLVNAKEENGVITESETRTGIWAWKHPHHDGSITYVKLSGDVRFFDVDFGYYPDKIVLHNVSLYAKPGQKIAFVGATGAGKTTITNLINRFYDIQDGKIRVDGININKIKKADLRRALGMVLQDTNLFTGTIKENIKYGKLDATDEEVYNAARLANVDQFVKHLPQGYDTVLTENGSELSQGQRQLIAIARAAITNPPVLILDEATSSIDTMTEALVTEAMDNLMEGRTVFVIAHRLSTVKNSKAIMVLDHGNIIERGSHDELIEAKGTYYRLYTGAFELE
jgi:ATP-binding cassette subfamily B protein